MLYKEYSMMHSKKIFLTFVLIIAGIGVHKYLHSRLQSHSQSHSQSNLTNIVQNKTRTISKTLMNTKTTDLTEITTPSGLRYIITQQAPDNAQQPSTGKNVIVHYTGFLDQNNVEQSTFDSSVKRGKPFSFIIGIGQVIKGWDEGVLSMKIGEKRRLIIPGNLGYGTRGVPGLIPANATLYFDVELLGVK